MVGTRVYMQVPEPTIDESAAMGGDAAGDLTLAQRVRALFSMCI